MQLLGAFLLCFFIFSLLFRVNVASSLGFASFAVFAFAGLGLTTMATPAFAALDSFPLMAIPFFMIAGTIMEYSGISRSLVDWIGSFVGRIRGSTGSITVLTCMAFGVLTGSAIATISSIGRIMFPELVRKGYRKDYAAALIASTCFLGILIPPSVPGIMYALSAGVSVSRVWLSTIGPAILFALLYVIYNRFSYGKHDIMETQQKIPFGQSCRNIGKQTFYSIPALLMPVIIFGGIYGGLCTPTEAGAICVVYGFIFFVVKKVLRKNEKTESFKNIMISSGVSTASVCIINVFANTSSRAISQAGISNALAEYIVAHVSETWQFLLIVNLVFLFLGCLLDITSAVLMITPLLIPSALAYGIDPIHFGGIMLVNLSVGFITPPFAGGLFMAVKISKVSYFDITKRIIPFLFIGLIVIAVTTVVPQMTTYLPGLFR